MDWQDISNWCRICGGFEGLLKVTDDLEQRIYENLFLKIPDCLICKCCNNFVIELVNFKAKVSMVQEMFIQLESFPPGSEVTVDEINKIREKFGLTHGPALLDEDESAMVVKEEEVEIIESEAEIAIEEYLDEEEDFEMQEVPVVARQRKHQKTEDEKLYEFKCHVCNQTFSKMLQLTNHCKVEHQTTPQVLCWCGTTLSTWKRLMAHKTRHIKENGEFNCSDCGSSYKTKTAFDKHRELKHGPNAVKFICSQCGKEFKEKQILKNHERTHLPDELKLKHPCSFCGKKFVNNHCLKIHIARIHEKVALHTCELCGKGCITKSDLNWHMDKHTQERNFECEICSQKFKSTNSLRLHKRRHLSRDKLIACPVCGKEFHSPAALSNHKLVHSDVKRYKCFCGNEYKRLETYKCHLSVHTGTRPFNCQWCNRSFVNSANCRKHKLKDHPTEVAEYEAIHGKKGVSLAPKRGVSS